MGHMVFSLGGYTEPSQNNSHRPAIPGLINDPKIMDMYHKIAGAHPGEDVKDYLTKEFVDNFDVVIVMHNPRWIENNWEVMKHKSVILRTIGQSNKDIERILKRYRTEGMKVVRCSPKEQFIPNYIGMDAVIRFYKDPEEYQGYVGSIPRIVNVSQSMFGSDKVPSRGDHMAKHIFDKVVSGFDWRIFGPDNDEAKEHNGGLLSFEDLKSMLRMNRVYLYTGTRPAMYTLAFIEAFMTGIPVVSIGNVEGNAIYDQKTFELPEIIGENGIAGFWSDTPEDLRTYCRLLLEDSELARRVGAAGRQRAIEYFGKDKIKQDWKNFFDSLGV